MQGKAPYDLVFARSDRRLGSNVKPSETDCDAKEAADRATLEAARAALGFKLEPSHTTATVVVVDRIEAPTEN